jgi:orotidine-5'-phosphate decarboxylase
LIGAAHSKAQHVDNSPDLPDNENSVGAAMSATMSIEARERLIVALDVPTAAEASRLVGSLDGVVSFFKVGLELFVSAGPAFVRELVASGKKVFLDLKFLDIDETVKRATQNVSSLGATFLTVHESGKTVAAAVEGCRGAGLKILTVTVLTSLDASDLQAMGFACSVEELVLRRARSAIKAGSHGVVASGREAARIRALAKEMGKGLIIVTPGIRPAGADLHDQKRATTPAEAIQAGADYLVVGRPINRAPDPRDAAAKIVDEMRKAFDSVKT